MKCNIELQVRTMIPGLYKKNVCYHFYDCVHIPQLYLIQLILQLDASD